MPNLPPDSNRMVADIWHRTARLERKFFQGGGGRTVPNLPPDSNRIIAKLWDRVSRLERTARSFIVNVTVVIVDVIEAVSQSPHTVSDTATVSRQTPLGITAVDNVSHSPHTITDTNRVLFGNSVLNGVDADDGYETSVPSFTNAGATIKVGNSSGVIEQAYVRFVLPYNIGGKTINYAALQFVPDANLATAANIRVKADTSGTAAAPTSKADYDSRTLTTAHTDVSLTATTGTKLPDMDVTAVLQEVATAGTTTSPVFMLLDNTSPTSSDLQLRSFAHSTGPYPVLVISYS